MNEFLLCLEVIGIDNVEDLLLLNDVLLFGLGNVKDLNDGVLLLGLLLGLLIGLLLGLLLGLEEDLNDGLVLLVIGDVEDLNDGLVLLVLGDVEDLNDGSRSGGDNEKDNALGFSGFLGSGSIL